MPDGTPDKVLDQRDLKTRNLREAGNRPVQAARDSKGMGKPKPTLERGPAMGV